MAVVVGTEITSHTVGNWRKPYWQSPKPEAVTQVLSEMMKGKSGCQEARKLSLESDRDKMAGEREMGL